MIGIFPAVLNLNLPTHFLLAYQIQDQYEMVFKFNRSPYPLLQLIYVMVMQLNFRKKILSLLV